MIDGHMVSLLVSSRNRPQLLIDAVRSVLEGTILPDEMIVVDQSDTPNEILASLETPETVAFRYIKSTTTGISRSRNIAFEAASHEIVVVIDDDCIVAQNWLGTIVRALLAAEPKSVITGRVLQAMQRKRARSLPRSTPVTSLQVSLAESRLIHLPHSTLHFMQRPTRM